MLVSFSTLCARSKRHKQVLLSCNVTQLEIAQAAVRAAEHLHLPIILTLDTTKPLLTSLSVIIAATLVMARESSASIAVEVRAEHHKPVIQQILESGAPTITPQLGSLSHEAALELVEWTAKVASAYGAETVLAASAATIRALLPEAVQQTGVVAVRIVAARSTERGKTVVPADVQDVLSMAKVPVIAEEELLSLAESRKLSRTGIAGLTIGKDLEEAFTAGIRTGLRNRSLYEPSRYLSTATLAVENITTNLLRQLNP